MLGQVKDVSSGLAKLGKDMSD